MAFKKIALLTVCISTISGAHPIEDLLGASARMRAMGGAGTALSADDSSVYYNPANLARCASHLVSLSADYVQSNFSVDNGTPNVPVDQVGSQGLVSLGGCFKLPYDISLGFHVTFGLPNPMFVGLRTVDDQFHMMMYGSGLKLPSAMAGIAYRPIKQLSVGVAFALSGGATLGMDMNASLATKQVQSLLSGPATASVAAIAGVTYEPLDSLFLGITYRSESYGAMLAPTHIVTEVAGIQSIIDPTMEAYLGYSPHQIAIGAAYSPLKALTVGVDVTWYYWPNYSGPFLQFTPPPENASAESALSKFVRAHNTKFSFRNVFMPRIGVEYTFPRDIHVRAGYGFRPAAVDLPTGSANLLDADSHNVSFGAGYRFVKTKNVELSADVYSMLAIMPNQTVEKAGSRYTFGGSAWNGGLAVTAGF